MIHAAVIPLNLAVGGTGVAMAALVALVSYVLGRPVTSAVSWASVRDGTRRLRTRESDTPPPSNPGPDTSGGSEPPTDETETDDADPELSLEDLRPSQPAAPAGTEQYAADWGVSEPIVSSVEGVEVERPGSLPAPNDDSPDSAR